MPYAVQKMPVAALPTTFLLSDALAIDPGRTLSSAPRVVIEARISASGNAIRQAGDLLGTSAAVAPGTRDLTIEINEVVR
jgi:cytochrome c-type biogenesis protein CcmH